MSTKAALGFYPGTIARAPIDGHYPGCKTMFFWTIRGYNKFFLEEKDGAPKPFIVVEALPTPYFFGLFVGVTVTFTKQLTQEEEEDMNFVTREVEFRMQDRKAKRAEMQAEAAQVEEAAKVQQAQLALIGKKYQDRVAHMKAMPTLKERNDAESTLNGGDPEILFASKMDAFQAGYVKGTEKFLQKDTK